jgi:hypothetical protein
MNILENILKLAEKEGKPVESASGIGSTRIELLEYGFYNKGAIGDAEIFEFCDKCDFLVRNIGIYGWDSLTDCIGVPDDYQTVFARCKYCPCAQINGVNVELFDKGVSVPIK